MADLTPAAPQEVTPAPEAPKRTTEEAFDAFLEELLTHLGNPPRLVALHQEVKGKP